MIFDIKKYRKQPQTDTKHRKYRQDVHHIAKSSRRAPKLHPRAPKAAPNRGFRPLRIDPPTYFGAGKPLGRPRARGVYLINQVIKEEKNRLDDLWMVD